MNRAERRRADRAAGRKPTAPHRRPAGHGRVPRTIKDVPFTIARGEDGKAPKVAACRCGWLSVGPNAPDAFARHLADVRGDRAPEPEPEASPAG